MPDWTKSMQHTYEYYIVDPGTWKDLKKIDVVKTSSINRDAGAETLGSASFVVTDMLKECYVRTYLVTIQNGVKERHPLGTHLVQTPSSKFNGKIKDISLDAYTPLLELKENQPAIGYFVPKDVNVMEQAYILTRDHVRAPVIKTDCPSKTTHEFLADPSDTWLTYLSDLIANQIYEDTVTNIDSSGVPTGKKSMITTYEFELDELGRIYFAPVQDIAAMQPIWTYTDDNSSILYPDISMEHDLYGIPNVVEVIYNDGHDYFYAKKVNEDPNSPISTVTRGREIVRRITNPSFPGLPNEQMIEEHAVQLLKALSTLQCTVSYTHGYCPVRLNDCVMLNYSRAGLNNVKAKVIHQNIKCVPGCPVTERAAFTIKLWEG